MVRRVLSIWTLAALACLGVRSASADGLPTFTGNVPNDFPIAPNNGVTEIVDHPMANGQSDPQHVAQSPWITQQGWTTGFEMKDMRLMYDAKTDTLAVGLNYFGIAGNGSGNGNPNVTDPRVTAAGGVDPPHLGGDKSITVVIDPTNSGTPAIVAGVPADKSHAGPGIDGFTVAQYQDSGNGWGYSYGKALPQFTGQLAFDPSAAHPGFEFTIPNFSKIPGIDLSKGFGIGVFRVAVSDRRRQGHHAPDSRRPAQQRRRSHHSRTGDLALLVARLGRERFLGAKRRRVADIAAA